MRWLLVFLLSLAPGAASADSIGPCPEGQLVVTNPATPGSGHHGGFHCEPDPNASHCSATPRRAAAAPATLAVVAALALLSRRR